MSWWLLRFSRGGSARYLSHLDTARALQRTFTRAGVPIALSQGMRPKPRISLPLPLPVGAAGVEELAVLEVPDEVGGSIAVVRALRSAAPPGISPLSLLVAGAARPRPQPLEAIYECELDGDAGAIRDAVERYVSATSVEYERVSPKGRRRLDLKEYIGSVASVDTEAAVRLRFGVRHRHDGAARPQELIDLIAAWAGSSP